MQTDRRFKCGWHLWDKYSRASRMYRRCAEQIGTHSVREALWCHRLTLGGSTLTFTAMIQHRFEVYPTKNVTNQPSGLNRALARSEAEHEGAAQESGPYIRDFG